MTAKTADRDAGLTRARELVSREPVDSPGFAEGLELLESDSAAGSLEASLVLGHLHCQYPGLPDAPNNALKNYQRAAAGGHPEALMRLADLAMFGYGQPRDDSAALAHVASLASRGFANGLCQLALLHSAGLACEVDDTLAASELLQAAAQGETLAFALLAERYLEGLGVPERSDLAWAWLDLACRRKFPAAQRRRAQLAQRIDPAQQQSGDQWALRLMDNIKGLPAAVAQVRLADSDPDFPQAFAQAVVGNFARLGEPALSIDASLRGASSEQRVVASLSPQALSWSPRVFSVDQFADAYERIYLLAAGGGSLISSTDQETAGGAAEVDPFDGECAVFSPPLVSPIVRIIQRRWAQLLQVHEQHFEPMSILRYGPGHEYAPHVDYFDSQRIAAHRRVGDLGGQRLITGLIYLVSPERGGETAYGSDGPTVSGTDGSAVFHFNTGVDGLPDVKSIHQGRPVLEGEKWLCRTAVRENNLYLNRETVL